MTFDLDCGEALGGRRLIATGLRVDGMSDDKIHADYSEHVEGKPAHVMVSLTYRIRPALPQNGIGHDIYATVRLDPPADPAFWDEVLAPGAERDATPGALATEASIGPFILPARTEKVIVHLVDVAITTVGENVKPGVPDRDLGEIIVDVREGTARWKPASTDN